MNPGEVHRNVAPLVEAAPVTLALPVHRAPTPAAFGADSVNVPVNDELFVVPVIVPFQSDAA